jgi:hypothetical protein
MGLGLFIDRPLGYEKAIGEPDLTPMLAHEAFSPSLARRRWQELKALCAKLEIPIDAQLDELFSNGTWPAGLPAAEIAECPRPTAALADVRKVADDFVILRTRPIGLKRMLEQLGIKGFKQPRLCAWIASGTWERKLMLFDDDLRPCVELKFDSSKGYRTRAGVEVPRSGVHLVWKPEG